MFEVKQSKLSEKITKIVSLKHAKLKRNKSSFALSHFACSGKTSQP